ncbi:MAG: hypothetical protein KF784_02095 [Fimbriimonadaceae bacterium]|nr:hypothetical protein [Fimbriimonadaceae bacterium]
MIKRFGFLIAATFLVSLLFAQDSVSLARRPKLEQTIKYQVNVTIDLAGTEAIFSGISTDRVTEINEDGSYSIVTLQSEVRVKYGERDYAPDPAPAQRVKYSAWGEILDIVGDSERGTAFRIANMTNIQLDPSKTLKVGEKWSIEIKPSANNDQIGAKMNYELTKLEEVSGMKTAVVKFTYAESSGAQSAKSEGTVWINVADGSLVKSDVKLKNAPYPGSRTPVDAQMTVTRLPS